MQYVPQIDLGEDRFKLHFGPYKTPRFRIGQTVLDQIRGEVRIVGITSGRIPWPIGQTKRAKTLVMFRSLVKALRNESAAAICHWWGITGQTVSAWRNALGIASRTVGSRKLRSAYGTHGEFQHVLEAAQATLKDPARGAKISAALKGRPKPKHIREMLVAARLGSKASEETRQKMREAHKRRARAGADMASEVLTSDSPSNDKADAKQE